MGNEIKFKRIFLCVIFAAMCFMFVGIIKVDAMNTGFETEDISVQKKRDLLSRIEISLMIEEPKKGGIQCFDVNEQGMIVISQKGNFCEEFCVYSDEGIFLYGYRLQDTSQSYNVEWDGENVNIYFVRSSLIMSLDPEGNIIDIKKVLGTNENYAYERELESPNRKVGDTTYKITMDMGIFKWISFFYSQIVIIDADGTEKIIYDVNSKIYLYTVVGVIGALLCFVCALLKIFDEQKKYNSKK